MAEADVAAVRADLAAERVRIEPWQELPAFREWLAAMDAELASFQASQHDVVTDEPLSRRALILVQDQLRQDFPEPGAADVEQHPDRLAAVDRYARFVGQMYVTHLEGEWINLGDPIRPAIRLPYAATYLEPRDLVAVAVNRPVPHLVELFSTNVGAHRAWVDAGRPETAEWIARALRPGSDT